MDKRLAGILCMIIPLLVNGAVPIVGIIIMHPLFFVAIAILAPTIAITILYISLYTSPSGSPRRRAIIILVLSIISVVLSVLALAAYAVLLVFTVSLSESDISEYIFITIGVVIAVGLEIAGFSVSIKISLDLMKTSGDTANVMVVTDADGQQQVMFLSDNRANQPVMVVAPQGSQQQPPPYKY